MMPCMVHTFAYTVMVTITSSTILTLATAELTVEPTRLAAEEGSLVVFTCSDSNATTNPSSIVWSYNSNAINNTTIVNSLRGPANGNNNTVYSGAAAATTTGQSGRGVTMANGTLTIQLAAVSDSGQYVCRVLAGPGQDDLQATASLVVYHMPNYLLEILITSGLCLIMILLLLAAHRKMQYPAATAADTVKRRSWGRDNMAFSAHTKLDTAGIDRDGEAAKALSMTQKATQL